MALEPNRQDTPTFGPTAYLSREFSDFPSAASLPGDDDDGEWTSDEETEDVPSSPSPAHSDIIRNLRTVGATGRASVPTPAERFPPASEYFPTAAERLPLVDRERHLVHSSGESERDGSPCHQTFGFQRNSESSTALNNQSDSIHCPAKLLTLASASESVNPLVLAPFPTPSPTCSLPGSQQIAPKRSQPPNPIQIIRENDGHEKVPVMTKSALAYRLLPPPISGDSMTDEDSYFPSQPLQIPSNSPQIPSKPQQHPSQAPQRPSQSPPIPSQAPPIPAQSQPLPSPLSHIPSQQLSRQVISQQVASASQHISYSSHANVDTPSNRLPISVRIPLSESKERLSNQQAPVPPVSRQGRCQGFKEARSGGPPTANPEIVQSSSQQFFTGDGAERSRDGNELTTNESHYLRPSRPPIGKVSLLNPTPPSFPPVTIQSVSSPQEMVKLPGVAPLRSHFQSQSIVESPMAKPENLAYSTNQSSISNSQIYLPAETSESRFVALTFKVEPSSPQIPLGTTIMRSESSQLPLAAAPSLSSHHSADGSAPPASVHSSYPSEVGNRGGEIAKYALSGQQCTDSERALTEEPSENTKETPNVESEPVSKSDQLRSDQSRSDQLRSDQLRGDRLRSDQLSSDEPEPFRSESSTGEAARGDAGRTEMVVSFAEGGGTERQEAAVLTFEGVRVSDGAALLNALIRAEEYPRYPFYKTEVPDPILTVVYSSFVKIHGRPRRDIFGGMGLSELEESLIRELRQYIMYSGMFSKEFEDCPLLTEGEFCLRFLQRSQFNVEEAAMQMGTSARWLATHAFLLLSPAALMAPLSLGVFYICGYDLHFRPVLVFKPSRINLLAQYRIEATLPLLLAFYLAWFRRHLAIRSRVEQVLIVIDAMDESLGEACPGPALKSAFTEILNHFPEYVYSVLVLSAAPNTWCSFLSPEVSLWISSMSLLDSFIPRNQREKQFGGEIEDIVHYFPPPTRASMSKKGRLYLGDVLCWGRPLLTVPKIKLPAPINLFDPADCFRRLAVNCSAVNRDTLAAAHHQYSNMHQDSHYWEPNAMELGRRVCAVGWCRTALEEVALKYKTTWAMDPALRPPPTSGVYWYGRDRELRPVLVVRVKRLLSEVKTAPGRLALLRWWLRWGRDYLLVEGCVFRWCAIIDMTDIGAFPPLTTDTDTLSVLTEEFPERLFKCFVLGASWSAAWLGKFASRNLLAADKIVRVHSVVPDLRQYIPLSQIDPNLGGTGRLSPAEMDVPTAFFPPLKVK